MDPMQVVLHSFDSACHFDTENQKDGNSNPAIIIIIQLLAC